MVIHFKTTKERRLDDIVAAVDELYAGNPLPTTKVGERCGLSNFQAWYYLHRAKEAGRINAVPKKTGRRIAGWVPANVDVSMPLDELRAHRAANLLRKAYSGKPVKASALQADLGVTTETVNRWLQKAAALGLARSSNSGWEPV